MKKILSLLILLPLMLSGCSGATKDKSKTTSTLKQGTNITVVNATTPKFAIYLVKQCPNYLSLDSKDIDKFDLQPDPIITEKDIVSCKWNDTSIRSDPEYKNKSSFTLKDGVTVPDRIYKQGYKGNGPFIFVVTADNVRIYAGCFNYAFSSVGFPAHIYVSSSLPLPPIEKNKNKNVVQLFDRSDKDFIHDTRIYDAFKSCGIPFLNK